MENQNSLISRLTGQMSASPFQGDSSDELTLACAGLQNRVAQLTDILEALLASPPTIECWPEWMHRAAALMSQYDSLVSNLQNLLSSFVVIPQNIVNDAVAENGMLIFEDLRIDVSAEYFIAHAIGT